MNKLTIATYNILADAYVLPKRYPLCTAEALEPESRRRRLLAELDDQAADVFALQEVEPAAFQSIQAHLGSDYHGVYEGRRDAPDGLAVFLRKSVVEFESASAIRDPALGKGNALVALTASFRFAERNVSLACVHLRWRPAETSAEDHTGLQQLRRVLDHYESTPASDEARFIAGDFNANSQSIVVAEAERRGFEISCRAQRPWDTTNINGRRRKIDYILRTPATLAPHPRTLPKLERKTPMPSVTHASDHLPLCIEFDV